MKIASITVYCNESFRLNDWVKYYQDYKDEIYKHVIVNNGIENDTNKLQNTFPDSVVLFSPNKALTTAYNIGLKYILAHNEIDAVMLVGNDIKFPVGNTKKLYDFLYGNVTYGMVSPILLKKDCEEIESFGDLIKLNNLDTVSLHAGKNFSEVCDQIQLSDRVPGGMNMAKRSFYETVGLQDEYLFMYSDELDMGIRSKKAGFQFASTKNVKAWHQHTNPPGLKTRNPMAAFLMGRNHIYLAKKHCSTKIVLTTALRELKHSAITNLSAWLKFKSKDEKIFWWWYFKGVLAGVFNIHKNPFA